MRGTISLYGVVHACLVRVTGLIMSRTHILTYKPTSYRTHLSARLPPARSWYVQPDIPAARAFNKHRSICGGYGPADFSPPPRANVLVSRRDNQFLGRCRLTYRTRNDRAYVFTHFYFLPQTSRPSMVATVNKSPAAVIRTVFITLHTTTTITTTSWNSKIYIYLYIYIYVYFMAVFKRKLYML